MPRAPSTEWVSYTINALLARRRDRVLIVTVQPTEDRWVVVALETRATDSRGGAAVDEVLEDHAHESLGSFDDEDEARRRAERYAATWRRRRRGSRPCDCGDVQAPAEAHASAEVQAPAEGPAPCACTRCCCTTAVHIVGDLCFRCYFGCRLF